MSEENNGFIKVLITGGSGFLGINLVRYLLKKENYTIRVLDLVDFEYPEYDQIEFIKGDIRSKEIVESCMKNQDIVIHTAAALPLYKKKDIFSTDIHGTFNLLNSAFENHVDRFIHISTTAVYGIPDHHPLLESDTLSGVGNYGKAKIEAEKLCETFREKGMCIPIIRPKSFIGPERLGVFSILYEWAFEGRNFPVIGDGKAKYQLLDVEDLCDAIYLCMILDKSKVNDTFNIGAKEFGSMKDDFQAVIDYVGKAKKVYAFPNWMMVWPLRILDWFHLSPLYKWVYETAGKESFVSIKKAEKQLGFNPKYSNKQSLIRNYEWWLQHKDEFKNKTGVSHRVPWKQGILKIVKHFF
mgnify:CR=1 FL=1